MNQPSDQPVPLQTSSLSGADLEAQVEAELAGKTMEQLMTEADASRAAPQPPPAPSLPDAGAKAPSHPKDAEARHADGEVSPEEPMRMEFKRGRITAIEGDNVFVDLTGVDAAMQGLVPLQQFERKPRIGSIMDFVVEREDRSEGLIILSREGAVSRQTWDHLHQGSVVEARVTGTNKGGLELELVGGIRAFMPASQIDLHHVEEMEPYVGQKLVAEVGEVNRRAKKVLLSRRRHLEHERERNQKRLWGTLVIGQTLEGKVSSLVPYGAFVDIGGVDGLIHVSDLSYAHVTKPEQVLKVGQQVTVKVLKLDIEKQRISLGLKQVAPDPWDTIAHTLRVGDKVSGTVLRTADFGAFVELQPGVEGLLPISEMSWKRIHNPTEAVQVGDKIFLTIISVDPEKRRLSLSLKQATGDPWMGAERKFAKDSEIEGRVMSTTDFGAFVELESGVEGMVHISELADQRVETVQDIVKVGDIKKFRVLEVDEDHHRIRLSLRPPGSAERETRQPDRGGERRGGPGGRRPQEDRQAIAQYQHRPERSGEPLMLTFKPKDQAAAKPLKGGIE